ncbi:MAG: GNAT family N-acetyltransferase [Gammaproteobacteria bacterium]
MPSLEAEVIRSSLRPTSRDRHDPVYPCACDDVLVPQTLLSPEPIAEEWDELADCLSASPYVRPGWIEAWWHAFGAGKLQIHTLRKKGRLVGVLPVARQRDSVKSVTNYHTPQFPLLADGVEAAYELARALFLENPRHVSIASLDHNDCSLKTYLQAAEKARYRVVIRPYQRSPYLDIKENWRTYEPKLSRKLIASIRRRWHQLEKQGKVSVEINKGRQITDKLLREAFAVEASGWKGRGRTAIQSNSTTLRFYTGIAHWAATRDTLRLFFLRLNHRPLAMAYALVERGVCYLLKGGYDEAYSKFAPGILLEHAIVTYCFSAGLSRIEFHGDADPYKLRFANAVHTQKRFAAYSRSPVGQLTWVALTYGRPAMNRMASFLRAKK